MQSLFIVLILNPLSLFFCRSLSVCISLSLSPWSTLTTVGAVVEVTVEGPTENGDTDLSLPQTRLDPKSPLPLYLYASLAATLCLSVSPLLSLPGAH